MSTSDSALQDHERFLDATHELISSARVEGTPVFGSDGNKLGTIQSVLIHKISGQAVYAVLAFGGFLHRREYVHPVLWDQLHYDVERHGYVVKLTREQIEGGPKVRLAEADRLGEPPPSSPFI